MSDYLDIEQKFKYHKENILQQFVQKGIYPDNGLIANHLADIDLNLSLFKNFNKTTGNKFNVNEYNESLKLIYKDITILYAILEELAIKEFDDLQNFINSYINELNSVVDTYESRAAYENNSTTLGDTLLFQNNNFTISNENSTTIVDLKTVEMEEASEIACIANINNIDNNNVIFSFTDENNELTVSPYNINNNTLILPGTKTIKNYDYSMASNQTVNGPIVMNIDGEIAIKNNYTILGGKDKMFLNEKEDNSFSVQYIPNSSGTLLFNKKLYINFYVVDGNSISFKFNKKPIATNFPIDENTMTNLKPIHHFYLECDEDFCFEIELDKGNIYAVKEDGIINNNKLYYTGPDVVTDFHIIEETPGAKKTYDAKLKIYNDNDNKVDIDNIVIKKLS